MEIKTPIGDIVDKLTILSIKLKNINDNNKILNIQIEYQYLKNIVNEIGIEESDFDILYNINEKLWVIEDRIRDKEYLKEFDNIFIDLARSVYITNDERARIKKEINIKYGSEFIEEKSYT